MGTTGEYMKEIKIDKYTAKEAMARVVEYMKLESVQTIEMITLDAVRYYQKENEWEEKAFDITFAENKDVLEALEIHDETLIKEAESHLFIKMFARFLHKNKVKVFLFAENDAVLREMQNLIATKSMGMKVVETATLEEHGVSDDMILNRINGVEADCVIAALPSPLRQEFIVRNRMLLNARIWVGLGTNLTNKKSGILERMVQYLKKK